MKIKSYLKHHDQQAKNSNRLVKINQISTLKIIHQDKERNFKATKLILKFTLT